MADVRITCWNARGYLASIPYIRHLLSKNEILAVSEHWVYENRLRCLSDISNTHSCFARSSKMARAEDYGSGRGQGGIAIFWDKKLKGVSVVSNIILDRACTIRLQTIDGGVIYFISVYMPAMGADESLESGLDDLSEVIDSRDVGAEIVIMGDFNGDVGWGGGGGGGGPRGLRGPSLRGSKVVSFFNRHGLVPLNMREDARGPIDTYEGQVNGSTLDYIAVSSLIADRAHSCVVHERDGLNTSDHLPVSAVVPTKGICKITSEIERKGCIKWNKLTKRDKYIKYQCVLEPSLRCLEADLSVDINSEHIIDDVFNRLSDSVHRVAETLPHTRFKKNLKPYWNSDLSRLKRIKVESYRRWVADARPRDSDNALFVQYKKDKKAFHVEIKRLAKAYEEKEILDAVKNAEFNRNSFWRLVKTARKGQIEGVSAVRRHDKVVVHELEEVLQVWAKHFAGIGTPRDADHYDKEHFIAVSESVSEYNKMNINDVFMETPFSKEEVDKAIRTLHLGKAPGVDGVTSEHILYAGAPMVDILCKLYNAIRDCEYIPQCFRRGVQVPLYKGKDTCILDPNNYRGITLLPTFNKIFEVLVWQRLKPWWYENHVVSELQGACREGFSCVHTAFNLRETLATSLETADNCFVAFYDVAKAFDMVWIDGLFKQMHDAGIVGKTWRLLYRCYIDFSCCVKLNGKFSNWYEPLCGIHQGGFMSLMKYTVFINSLLVTLKEANICCKIYRTPSTPLGYADDVATCCPSKRKLDFAMDIVYKHGCAWRYEFNAKKSGVLVYGESVREHECNSVDRCFKLGPDKVKERVNYDHVGIRNTIFYDDNSGIEERFSKGRRSFNAIAGIGMRKGGITMATCNVIFWSVVVPSALFGCELWIMDEASLNLIEDFQNYIVKRVQRFHPKIPNACSYYGLGWMRLERVIQICKLMYFRTIMVMRDEELPKKIFCERAMAYFNNTQVGNENSQRSVVFDILNVCEIFGLSKTVKDVIEKRHFYSKSDWKKLVWQKGWQLEDVYWRIEKQMHKSLDILNGVCPLSRYLNWWMIADKFPKLMKECEFLARIISHASVLKGDDFKYKGLAVTAKTCDLCNEFEVEDARHLLTRCPYFVNERDAMFNEISQIEDGSGIVFFESNVDLLFSLLGRPVDSLDPEQMERIWLIILRYVSGMYRECVRYKRGIG